MKIQYLLKLTGLLLLSLCLSSNCWAGTSIDYNDANCEMAFLMDVDESPLTDSAGAFSGTLKGAGEPDYATASPPKAYTPGYYDFDGTDDYVAITATTEYGNADMSVLMWFKRDSYDIYDRVVYQDDSFQIVDDNDYDIVFYDGGGNRQRYCSQGPVTGTWQHICATFNAATNAIVFYIDGVSQSMSATSDYSITGGTNDIIYIGTGQGNFMDGKYTEFALFTDILTSTEVNDIMDNGLAGSAPPPARRFFLVN